MSNKLLANLDVAVGDNLSAAIELQTRSGTATNLRLQVVFLDGADAVVAGGTFDGEDVTVIYGNYAASPDITGPWYRSRLFNMVVPAGAVKINVGYAYDSSTVGTITASRKPILNKGAKPAPYSPPADNIPALSVVTLDATDWIPFDDQGIARKTLVSAINLTLFNNNLPDTDFDHDQLTNYSVAQHVDWSLSSQGSIHSTNLPAIALTDVFTVANEASQLALTVQEGDVAIRSEESKSYIHNGGVAGTMADWSELLTPTDVVTSVAGKTGVVTLVVADLTDFTDNSTNWDLAFGWGDHELKTKSSPTSSTNSIVFDLANGYVFDITLTENITSSSVVTIGSGTNLQELTIKITQDGTGGFTFAFPPATKWVGGTAPTITSGANKIDIFKLTTYDNGTTYFGEIIGQDFT